MKKYILFIVLLFSALCLNVFAQAKSYRLRLQEPEKENKPLFSFQDLLFQEMYFQYANKGLHFIMYDDTVWYLEQVNNFIKSK